MKRYPGIQKGRLRLSACVATGIALTGIGLAALSNFVPSQDDGPRKSTGAPVPPQGKLGEDLFLAIDHRDTKAVQDLLSKGADPNSKNGLQFVPIYVAAASHQPDVVDALLKAGAEPDHKSTYGTPLMFACVTGNVQDAEKFLSLGADPNYQRTDGFTPLMEASYCGCAPLVQELINHKAKVDTQDDAGSTALILAARIGSVDTGKSLIAAGANVNIADADGLTPVMHAAMNGHADFVKLLLDNGAKPNAADSSGRTALILAGSYGDFPDVVKTLMDGKANPSIKDSRGMTALKLATARGFDNEASVLNGGAPVKPASPTRTPDQAVKQSLQIIQQSTSQFAEATTCVSCHQDGLARITTGLAQEHGFKLDPAVQKVEQDRVMGMVLGMKPLHEQALKSPDAMKQLPLIEINEVNTTYTWLLDGLVAQGVPPSDATAAMAMCLARQQSPDGCWTFSLPRVPMQSSVFTFTALAVEALRAYGPKDSTEVSQRIAKAKDWLTVAKPQNSEDRAFRLMGLKWAGADKATIDGAAADVMKDQRPDGGWSQLPGGYSDAYATGQALFALHSAGVAASTPAYKQGARYLLLTQDSDGSWYVNKRAIQANNYFDAGFPHGESQYSSFNGTCWATMALLPLAAKH